MMIFRYFIIACQFLTLLPISKKWQIAPKDLARSMAFYPAVGLLLGGILWLAWKGLSALVPPPISDFLLIAILVFLTGAIHLDGLADTADGLWGGKDREEALKIMRDEQIGAYGAIALILLLIGKYLALSQVPVSLKGEVLLILPAYGRWAIVAISSFSKYARSGPGLARPFIEHLRGWELTWASLTILAASFLIIGLQGWADLIFLGLVSFLCLWYFRMKLGGITGDCLGAACELVELSFLVSVVALQKMIHG